MATIGAHFEAKCAQNQALDVLQNKNLRLGYTAKANAGEASWMYFVLSKLLWMLAAPSNAIALTIAAGAAVSATRFRRIGVAISAIGAFVLLLCGFGPVGVWLLRPLEDRFERPTNLAPPDGIIVLGGDISPAMFEDRGVLAPNGARLTEAVALARRFPLARIVFTGGSSNLLGSRSPRPRPLKDFSRRWAFPAGERHLRHDRAIHRKTQC